MRSIKLSYIICTRNRLNFLKISLNYLLKNIAEDEEVIVVDGNSSDGTQDYLDLLFKQGLIHQYISEKDKNQAHAWNKGILLARGELLKKVIDDDLFCYSAIQDCKQFMLENPSIDACISDTLGTNLADYKNISKESRLKQYLDWKSGKTKSFTFGDISLLLRKSSIPFLGLYDTSFVMLDYEYSLRISYLRSNIAYYTGFNAMSVFNPYSVSSNVTSDILKLESQRANPMYEYAGDGSEISSYSKLKIFVGKLIHKIRTSKHKSTEVNNNSSLFDLLSIYEFCYQYLNKENLNQQKKFYKS